MAKSFSNMFNPGCNCCGRFCLGVTKGNYRNIGFRVNVFDPNITGIPAQILQAASTLVTPFRSELRTGPFADENILRILYEEADRYAVLDPTEWITPEVHPGSFRHSLGWPGTTVNIYSSANSPGHCPFRTAHASQVTAYALRDPDEVFLTSPGHVTANPFVPYDAVSSEFPHFPTSLVSIGLLIRIRIIVLKHKLAFQNCISGQCNPDLRIWVSGVPQDESVALSARCSITIQANFHINMRWIKRSDETYGNAYWGYPGENSSGEQIVTRLPVSFGWQAALVNPKDKIGEAQWVYTADGRVDPTPLTLSGGWPLGLQEPDGGLRYGSYPPEYPTWFSISDPRHRVGLSSLFYRWFTLNQDSVQRTFGPPDNSVFPGTRGGATGFAMQTGGGNPEVEIETVQL